jgi:hypothetical protein
MMFRNSRLAPLVAVAGLLMTLPAASQAVAGQKFELGGGAWLSVGAGLRASYVWSDNDAVDDDWTLNSARIFTNAQVTKVIGFTFNTEIDKDNEGDIDSIRMMDAIVRLEFSDAFNIYGGRMLAPSDRANLDGPYYLGTWDYPFVSAYPQIFQGRDNGVTAWGYALDKRLYYAGGVFAGCTDDDNACHTSATGDSPLLAARFTYNFWDRESGYYTSSDYYGEKEILAIGLVGQFQQDATGTVPGIVGDFSAFNIDVLMQKKVFGGDVLTLEGAYYVYDTDDLVTPGLVQGESYFILASYMFDHKIGIGKFQPVVRYQNFDKDFAPDAEEWSAGTNYIIKGHDARLSAIYSEFKEDGSDTVEKFTAGVQLQF